MNNFFPFIHKIDKKKKEDDLQPLYIELEAPLPQEKPKENEDQSRIIILEL